MLGKIRIGDAIADFSASSIFSGNTFHRIEPKVLDVLRVLVKAQNQVVSRNAIIDEVWGVDYGGDERLSRAISLLRRAFGDSTPSAQYIETVPKRGYRLIAKVETDFTAPETDKKGETVKSSLTEETQDTGQDALSSAEKSLVKTDEPGHLALDGLRQRPLIMGVVGLLFTALIISVFFTSKTTRPSPPEISVAEASIPSRSLAVLPFVSLSPREEDGFFAEGLSEELLNTFAKAEGLKLASRTSSFAYKDRDTDIREIGRELSVAYVLEGSIRRADDRIRVTAQLISAQDGYHLWSETYDRALEDIFVVQDDIARRVAESLNTRLIKEDDELLFDTGTRSAAAFEQYVQGRNFLTRRGSWMVRAQAAYEASIEADPGFARAYAGLAIVNVLSPIYQNVPKEIAWLRAKDNADKALALDPALSEPYAVYGNIEASKFDWAAALQFYEEGEANNPDDTTILQWQAELLSFLGYLDKASAKIQRAVKIDPGSDVLQVVAGNIEEARRDLDRAAKHYRELENRGFRPVGLAMLEAQLDNPDKAARTLAELNFKRKFITNDDIEPMAQLLSQVIQGQATVEELVKAYPTVGKNDDSLTTFHLFAGNSEAVLKRIEAEADEDYDSFFLIWTNVDRDLRQHDYFTTFAKNTGLLDFWMGNGWPDQCNFTKDKKLECH